MNKLRFHSEFDRQCYFYLDDDCACELPSSNSSARKWKSCTTQGSTGGTITNIKPPEIISNSIRSNRTCTVQIANCSEQNMLSDPRFYCYVGEPYHNMPSEVRGRSRGLFSFAQRRDSETGVAGCVTYRLGKSSFRLAIMFFVPYNQIQQCNYFGLAILDENDAKNNGELACGTLFYKMYYDEDFVQSESCKKSPSSSGKKLIVTKDEIFLSGIMSERGKAILKVDMMEKKIFKNS